MPSTGGSRSGSGGDDTGHAAGGGEAAGGMGGGGGGFGRAGVGMFGPLGLRSYRRSGQQISFVDPRSLTTKERERARSDYYSGRVDPQSFLGKFMASLYGKPSIPPTYTGKDVRADVFAGMQYRSGVRGMMGRMDQTRPGIATTGLLSMTPAGLTLSAGLGAVADIVSNYYEDEASVRKDLSGFYSESELDKAFGQYQTSRVEGLEGFGGGEAQNEGVTLKDLLSQQAQPEAPEPERINPEEMRESRRKRTQRIYAGALSPLGGTGNQVRTAKLLGQ